MAISGRKNTPVHAVRRDINPAGDAP